jgi:hypothetical protein
MSAKKKKPAKLPAQKSTDRYQTSKYVEYIFTAELSILNADSILPQLTDGKVAAALQKLAGQVKAQGLPHYLEQPTDTEGLLAWLIVQNWTDLFSRRRKLSQAEMAGCLEAVLESVRLRMRKPNQRYYLTYLKKFIKRAGLSAQAVPLPEREATEIGEEMVHNLDNMSLSDVGHLWQRRPDIWGIEDAFENKAQAQIVAGREEEVITLCDKLLQRASESYFRATLLTVQGKAYHRLGQTEKAVAVLTAARLGNADYLGSRHELAEIYLEQGDHQLAIAAWRECLGGDYYDTSLYHQIALSYRQMGDLAGEESAWRDLLKVRERRSLVARLFRRHRSVATLAHLADCLERQGKMDEAKRVVAQLERSRPHPDDPFEDWAYWVRHWLEQKKMAESLLVSLQGMRDHLLSPLMSDLLQACVYDWLRQPQRSTPLWRSIRRHLLDRPHGDILSETCEILGSTLPASSRLFELTQEIESGDLKEAQ